MDDVPIKGLHTRYELEGGGYQTIEGNEGIRIAPALRPVTYAWGVVLVVKWKAVGWFIYQINPFDPRKKYFCYFGALILKE